MVYNRCNAVREPRHQKGLTVKTICEYVEMWIARKYAPDAARPVVNEELRRLTAQVLAEQPKGRLVNRHATTGPDGTVWLVRVTRGKQGKLRTRSAERDGINWMRDARKSECYGGLGWINCPDCWARMDEIVREWERQRPEGVSRTYDATLGRQVRDAVARENEGTAYRRSA